MIYKIEKELIKKLSPQKKLNLTIELYYSAFKLKKSYLISKYPSLTDVEIRKMLNKIFINARS